MKSAKIFCFLFLLIGLFSVSLADIKENEQNKKTLLDNALTPVGWVIGAAVAPVSIGIECSSEIADWSFENIVSPAGDTFFWTIDKTAEGIFDGTIYSAEVISKYAISPAGKYIIAPTYDYILAPSGRLAAKGIDMGAQAAFDYVILPAGKAILWSGDKISQGVDYAMEYAIVPVVKGSAFGFSKAAKYALVPIEKGAAAGYDYVVIPVEKGALFAAKYTVVPVAKAAGNAAEILSDTLQWSADNVIYPVSYGITSATGKVVSPVNSAIKASTNSIKTMLGK